MSHRCLAPLGVLAMVIVVVSLAPVPVVGQAPSAESTAAPPSWTPPRTPDGQPDLQGVWNYATLTPLERPSELAGKQVLTSEEAAEFERETLARRDNDRRDEDPSRTPAFVNGAPATADVARAYNQFWWDFGTRVVGTRRTSLVIDPPDGRIPALSLEAQRRVEDRAAKRERAAVGPEDRGLSERCINWGTTGPPMVPGAYNNNVQLLQIPGYVVLFNEMIHDARIVPMDGRPHGTIRQVLGDSRGRWEGHTLVVETTNFTDKTAFRGASEHMHLVERFTRVDTDTLLYEFTVTDPTSFARPWTAQMPMIRSAEKIYEYACHEGNYGMFNLLSGARTLEKAAKESAWPGKTESR